MTKPHKSIIFFINVTNVHLMIRDNIVDMSSNTEWMVHDNIIEIFSDEEFCRTLCQISLLDFIKFKLNLITSELHLLSKRYLNHVINIKYMPSKTSLGVKMFSFQ